MLTRIAISILVGLIFSFPKIKELFLIYRVPIRRINKLPESGQVQIIGKADTKNTKSPLKRTNCCLWKIIVEEDQGRSRKNVKIFEKMSTEPFDLVDSTGRIQVFPANADLILHDDLDKKTNSITPFPPRMRETLQSLGIETSGLVFQRLLHVYEQVIQPGDDIFLMGEVIMANGVKVIRSSGKFPLVISDYRDYEVISNLFGNIIVQTLVTALPVFVVLVYISNR